MPDLFFQLQAGTAPRTAAIRQRMLSPIPEGLALQLGAICQRGGAGSFEEQFLHQTEMTKTVSTRWKETEDFGNRKRPTKTLYRSGKYQAAWTGRGDGSVLQALPNGVRVGVDSNRFPQARVFQRSGITMIPVTDRMRGYLAANFDVHLKKSTTRLKVEGRPVSMNRGITGRARKPVARYFLHGTVSGALGVAA